MSTTAPGQQPGPDASLGDLVASITRDVHELVTGQVELAKAELRESAQAAGKTGGLFAGAGLFALLGLVFLLVTIAFGLVAAGLAPWAAFLIVTAGLLLAAGILAALGRSHSRSIKAPERSIAAARAASAAIGGSTPV